MEQAYHQIRDCLEGIDDNARSIYLKRSSPNEFKHNLQRITGYGEVIGETIAKRIHNPEKMTLLKKTVIHELKNPLHGILGFTDMMTEDLSGKSEKDVLDYCAILNKCYKKMTTVIPLLALGEISKKNLQEKSSYFNLPRILEEDANSCEHELKNPDSDTGIFLYKFVDDSDKMIYACQTGLEVLVGINGGDQRKWAPKGTAISQSVSKKGENFIINMENAYGNKKTLDVGLDEGVGTVFTKEILDAMGGNIESYSESRINRRKVQPIIYGNRNAIIPQGQIFGKEIIIPATNFA